MGLTTGLTGTSDVRGVVLGDRIMSLTAGRMEKAWTRRLPRAPSCATRSTACSDAAAAETAMTSRSLRTLTAVGAGPAASAASRPARWRSLAAALAAARMAMSGWEENESARAMRTYVWGVGV
eukprot:scaffold2325_cov105-Isochrysis_galbana.AAC.14